MKERREIEKTNMEKERLVELKSEYRERADKKKV
jgi:hypothetical protein